MITKLTINNFKSLQYINMEGMKRICLVSGKNNIGKSTLLEALFLLRVHVKYDSFQILNSFRGAIAKDWISIWEPLFYGMNMDKVITIATVEDSVSSELTYKKDVNYLPKQSATISENVLAQFRAATKNTFSLMFQYTKGDYTENGHFFPDGDGILSQIGTNLPGSELRPEKATRYLNSIITHSTEYVIDTIGELELAGEKSTIINFLKEMDPSIEDIITISRQNVSQLHIRTKGKWIPLQYAGDGVMKLLHICLAIMKHKDGLLLIDELETGFHYSMYEKLWNIIDKISKKANCQVIATTHSYELIAAVRDGLVNKEDFVYYRLGKSNDGIKAYDFDFEDLSGALHSNMEVR